MWAASSFPGRSSALKSSSEDRRACENCLVANSISPLHTGNIDADTQPDTKPDTKPDCEETHESHPALAGYLDATRESAKAEMRRAMHTSSRYYGGKESKATATAVASGITTDDGYLTKYGAKISCPVCCRGGHKPHECPEVRCWVCFQTGHNVKECPNSKKKCTRCYGKGHDEQECHIAELSRARQYCNLLHVRCMNCGKTGHVNCGLSHDTCGQSHDTDALPLIRSLESASSQVEEANKVRQVLLGQTQPGMSRKIVAYEASPHWKTSWNGTSSDWKTSWNGASSDWTTSWNGNSWGNSSWHILHGRKILGVVALGTVVRTAGEPHGRSTISMVRTRIGIVVSVAQDE